MSTQVVADVTTPTHRYVRARVDIGTEGVSIRDENGSLLAAFAGSAVNTGRNRWELESRDPEGVVKIRGTCGGCAAGKATRVTAL